MKNLKSKKLIMIILSILVVSSGLVVFITRSNDLQNDLEASKDKNETTSVEKETIPEEKPLTEEQLIINNFLEENHYNLDLNNIDSLSEFSIFKEDIEKHQIIFIGEGHAVSKNYDIRLALAKYLNKNAGIKYLLGEMGYSSAAILNKYIQTGDTELLDMVCSELKGTISWTKEYYEYWEKLYEYNKDLEDSEKLTLIGIDIEHQYNTAIDYLYSLEAKGDLSQKIKPTIEEFINSKESLTTKDNIKELAYKLQKDIDDNTTDYEKYFGDNFFDFDIVVDNIVNRFEAYEGAFTSVRERSMYDNFKKIYNHYPQEKYFGQWGMEHVYKSQCRSYGRVRERLAIFLNEEGSPVKGETLTIAIGYKNCSKMYYSEGIYGTKSAPKYLEDINLLEEYAKGDYTLFRLIGEESPFNNKAYFVQKPIGGVTVDYFDYVLLMQNSEATTPLE